MPQQITRRAYAKVNLALAVGPALPQGHPGAGFHPIASWMACIDLFDELTVTRLDGGAESIHRIGWGASALRQSSIDWPTDKDLAVRAHRLLEREAGRTLPLEMDLAKRIPVGGGLGGGSSDAAAALLAIDELFELGLGPARLAELGAALGSDVPYFVDDKDPPRPAVVTGLGQSVRRLERVGSGLLLLVPPFGCPTGRVYSAFDGQPRAGVDLARAEGAILAAAGSGRADSKGLINDLAGAAAQVESRIAALSVFTSSFCGTPAHLSGSGSSLLVLCPEGEEERRAEDLRTALLHKGREPRDGWFAQVRVRGTRLV